MLRLLPLICIALLTTGCGSMNSLLWFSEEDPNPPAELVDLGNTIPLQTLWEASVGEGTDEQRLKLVPSVYLGRVYVADAEGIVEALDADSGNRLWQVETELPLSGGPGTGDGLVLVGSNDGDLVALDADTGNERWRTRLSSEVLSVPKAGSGVAVVHTMDGTLFGLDSATGENIWRYDLKVPVLTLRGSNSPVINGSTVICGFANGKLAALDLATGVLQWEATISVASGRSELERMVDIDGELALQDNVVYVTTFQGSLAAVTAATGVVLWRRDMSSHAGASADAMQVYVSDTEDQVWAVDPRNGAALWKQKRLHARRLSTPAVLGEYVLVGDFEGYVHWLSRSDGRMVARVRVGSDPIATAPVVVNGVAYIYGDGGDLAAVRPLTTSQP
jgi:outer membrane protein assembly factor BamB